MRYAVIGSVVIAAFALLPIVATAGPTVTIYTDADTYQSGDTIEVSLAALNLGNGMSVDLYVGLLTPDGGLYTLSPYGVSGWSGNIEAWIPDIYVPPDFSMIRTPLFWFDVPSSMPPIQGPGEYNFASLLTRVGTFEWASELSLAPFALGDAAPFHGGDITTDMTLSGEIELTSDVVIHEGALLTILHDSTVRLGEGFGIKVYGGLIAEGDSEDSIVFERLDPDKPWENISFWESADDDQCRLVYCSISGGSGTYYKGYDWGGAIFCHFSSPIIVNNTITDNSTERGGGIGCWESSPTIVNNTIAHNYANQGGGIFCRNSPPTIENNIITDNRAKFGGGIFCWNSSPTIKNNTITGNRAFEYYGGIRCFENSSPTIVNCIIWGNGDDLYHCSATYCCIEGDDPGEGNVHENPMFVTGPLGEYYLASNSPCIDAGSQSVSAAGLPNRTTQTDGTRDTGRVDIGYHYPIPSASASTVQGHVYKTGTSTQISSVQVSIGSISDTTDAGGFYSLETVPLGEHTIEASVSGCEPNSASIVVSEAYNWHNIYLTPLVPTAFIESISPNPATQGSDAVEFYGDGEDEGSIRDYNWRSDIDGYLDNEDHFSMSADDLSVGVHTIYFKVKDNDNNWSVEVSRKLTIKRGEAFHGGGIAQDITLSGEIELTRDVVIHEGAVLTISSESTVRLGKNVGIKVYGGLIAEGDRKDSIVFERLDPDKAWENISFLDSADDDQCRLVNCSISGGSGTLYEVCYWGGAIFCQRSSPTIENNTITDNSAVFGGGIFCRESSPTIKNNIILDNNAESGGGIDCVNGSSPIIENNTITGNRAHNGGGITCRESSPTIKNNIILDNNAEYGGGIDCLGENSCSPTIKNNIITGNSAHGYGGGIDCVGYNTSPTIENNTITDNSAAERDGGGISCGSSSPNIRNNTITGNSAHDYGGGISCSWNSSPTIENNTITNNTANIGGAGIDCCNSKPFIKNNTIMSNSAEYGGGICSENTLPNKSPTIKNNTITDNSADWGGGICCGNSSPTIKNNTITDNSADYGGGMYCCYNSSPNIRNNTISANSAHNWGGAIHCSNSSPTIENNTIANNSAHQGGGGIDCYKNSSPTVVDCIIWGNGDDLYDCSATYCCNDPMFVTGPLGEYYLHPDSPCIDAGSRSASAASLSNRTTQADGTPDTGTVDMGYHYPIP